jgi:hypothetical protein
MKAVEDRNKNLGWIGPNRHHLGYRCADRWGKLRRVDATTTAMTMTKAEIADLFGVSTRHHHQMGTRKAGWQASGPECGCRT